MLSSTNEYLPLGLPQVRPWTVDSRIHVLFVYLIGILRKKILPVSFRLYFISSFCLSSFSTSNLYFLFLLYPPFSFSTLSFSHSPSLSFSYCLFFSSPSPHFSLFLPLPFYSLPFSSLLFFFFHSIWYLTFSISPTSSLIPSHSPTSSPSPLSYPSTQRIYL